MRLTSASADRKAFAAARDAPDPPAPLPLKRAAVLFEPFGDLVFIDFPVGDSHDKIEFLAGPGAHIMAVEPQGQTHRFKSDPFISVDKGMVQDEGVPQNGELGGHFT